LFIRFSSLIHPLELKERTVLLTVLFAFLSGIVTVASPCVLPVLPFLLSGTIGGKFRPYGIIVGFIASFSAFTLSLSGIVSALGISGDALRWASVVMLFGFGLTLLVPAFHTAFERFSSKSVGSMKQAQGDGFLGGIAVGATLGILWSPCVGPIMSSVITLALSGNVNSQAVFVTLAFSVGTAIPMLLVMLGGRGFLKRVPWLMQNLGTVQRGFGVVLVVFAVGIGFNLDRKLQSWFLDTFPTYSEALTGFETNAPIDPALKNK
jgi:cytochrome c-type biogenesis protein